LVYSLSWLGTGATINSWHTFSVDANTSPVSDNGWRVYNNGAPGSAAGAAKSLNDWLTDPTYGTILNGGTVLGQGFNLGSYQRQCRVGIDWLESSLINNGNRVDFVAPPTTVCASGCNYTTIQAAIDAATAGDVIQVAPGTYSENIVVNKSVTLKGAQFGVKATGSARSGGETIIDGTGNSSSFVVTIEADNVTIDGFKVEIRNAARDGINTRTGSPVSPATTALRTAIALRNNWVYANLPSRTHQQYCTIVQCRDFQCDHRG
jgi:hypothetical protein